MHSTITALLPIVTNIAIGFNQPKPASRTVMVSLDISKAFDAVDHDLLLGKISDSTLHSNVVRWMAAYLRGRTAVCLFQGATSSQFTCHSGVPQGSVLSPVLFNFFVSGCPELAHLSLSYADDFHLSVSGPDVLSLGRELTQCLSRISQWAKENKLVIAPEKSSVTVFTPNTREVNMDPCVYLDGVLLPVDRRPKWLGFTITNMGSPTPHLDSAVVKGNSRLQLMKAIRGLDFGDKETLRLTYNTLVKPVLEYGAPIYFPITGPEASSIRRLQSVQNGCMRVITGSHLMADTDHLLAETNLLSIKDHLGLICKQFLASAYREDHPSHHIIKLPTGSRPGRKEIRHTLQSRYDEDVKPYLRDGVLPESLYKQTIKDIHTKVVTESKSKLINKVLGRAPPDIDPSEMSLPRLTRSTLSQIRSQYCNELKTYQARIGSSPNDICPVCRGAPHTTRHLFECPAAPTNLKVLSLWKDPRGAADFLRSLPSFDRLPPNPPYPRPPPMPPPRTRPLDLYVARGAPT